MIAKLNLEVKKLDVPGSSWLVSKLGKFRSEELANKSLNENRSFYEYWADSAGVIGENMEPVIITVNL